ncbi:MAG TPA: nuclear transport factor 2 family protein, partial [Saprospiraceae bacterium]|nr:nuclear transport factor 2 family protein [Saprospiraceae bacterium]
IKTNEQNVKIIESLYNAFATGDMPTVLGLMDPAIEWNEAESNSLADGNPYIGPDAVLQGVFARLGANHEYFGLKNVKTYSMDDHMVLATLRYDAKVKATGTAYDAQAAHLWTLSDQGKVIAFQQFVDTKKLADSGT